MKEAIRVTPTDIPGVGVDSKGRPVPAGRVEYITRTVGEETTGQKTVTVRVGGPLDMMASNAAGAVAGSSGEGTRLVELDQGHPIAKALRMKNRGEMDIRSGLFSIEEPPEIIFLYSFCNSTSIAQTRVLNKCLSNLKKR